MQVRLEAATADGELSLIEKGLSPCPEVGNTNVWHQLWAAFLFRIRGNRFYMIEKAMNQVDVVTYIDNLGHEFILWQRVTNVFHSERHYVQRWINSIL